jgi:acyl-CoA reductase-like NAD-dependent aldehyde dehydrogenase
VSVEQFGADLGAAVDGLLGDDAKAADLLGAVVNDDVLSRIEASPGMGRVLVPSREVHPPTYPDARVRTPTVLLVDAADEGAYGQECFGPVAFVVTTASSADSVEVFRRTVAARGAITAAVYSTSEPVLGAVREAALDVGVALSENLTQGVYVNQSAAFSDFHATGANAAANASLTDGHFVSGRFRVVQTRRHLPAEAPAGSSTGAA